MDFYLPRFIDNLTLPTGRALQPIFEAVFNAIQAIESAQAIGKIVITIHRDEAQQELQPLKDDMPRSIRDFVIEDNGIGFDDDNYKSFLTSGSPYKPRARGVGRFFWLKAFDGVQVDSIFMDNDSYKRRTFDFIYSDDGVENNVTEIVSERQPRTVISLKGLKRQYEGALKKGTAYFADRLVEHFLIYFLSSKCPSVTLIDGTVALDLNQIFRERVRQQGRQEPFQVNEAEFSIIHLRLYSSHEAPKVYLCAEGLVAGEPLNLLSDIADLKERLRDDGNDPFVYAAYVEGEYLDERLDEKRAEFNIPKSSRDSDVFNPITLESLRSHIVAQVKKHLATYLQPVSQGKLARIKEYVSTQAPQYKPILKYKPEVLDKVQPGLSDEKLDAELYRINAAIHSELRQAYQQLLRTRSDITNLAEYRQKFESLVETLNEVSKSELALYVVHRKLILDLLEKTTSAQEDGVYPREERIHHLIYPMKTTSDDVVPYEQQNLWIIDERLAFHKYLASDKELFTHLKTKSAMRPDIVVFGFDNNPFAAWQSLSSSGRCDL
jgi:hypothetical protein